MERSYERPEMQDLGTLAEVTLGSGGHHTDNDGLGSSLKPPKK